MFEEVLMAKSSSADNGEAFSRLSQQEKQVLLRLSDGRSDQEIAKALFWAKEPYVTM